MVLGNLACTSHGSCMISTGEAFEPLEVIKIVPAEKVTSLYAVPAMFIAELNLPQIDDYDFSSLRTGDHGWIAMSRVHDARYSQEDEYERARHLLWNDGDLAGKHADFLGR